MPPALLRYLLISAAILGLVLANQAINQPASAGDFLPPVTKAQDVLGSPHSYADADLVGTPKWSQATSLGLAVWRFLMFTLTASKFVLRPLFFVLHILYAILRPITLLVQLTYHITIGIPVSMIHKISRMLYPAYLFLGSAALIGLLIGLSLAIFSRLLQVFMPSTKHEDSLPLPAFDTTASHGLTPKDGLDKGRPFASPVKRSPPSTRTIMSSQPSLQTPTIYEESEREASSLDEADYDTSSDHERSPTKSSADYWNYKAHGSEGTRRRRQ